MTIEINKISVDESSLIEQLEAQGYELKKKPKPRYNPGDTFYTKWVVKYDSGNVFGYEVSPDRKELPGELIEAYSDLHTATVVGDYDDVRFVRDRITAIKKKWSL